MTVAYYYVHNVPVKCEDISVKCENTLMKLIDINFTHFNVLT